MLTEHKQYFYPLRLVLDAGALVAGFFLCAFITSTLFPDPAVRLTAAGGIIRLPACGDRFAALMPLAIVVPLLMLYYAYVQEKGYLQKLAERVRQTVQICCAAAALMTLLSLVLPGSPQLFRFILLWIPLTALLLIAEALLAAAIVRQRYRRGDFVEYVVIHGTDETAQEAARLFDRHPEWGVRVVGFLADDSPAAGPTCAGHPVLGDDNAFTAIADHHIIDCVLWPGDVQDIGPLQSLAQRCSIRGIDFIHTSSVLNETFPDVLLERMGAWRLFVHKAVYHHPAKLFIKRMIDACLSLALIILATPLWLIIPLIIRLDSPGPALFRQERVGRHCRRFTMYKFRSMVHNAEQMLPQVQSLNEMDGPVFKITDDPRFTRLGKFLRRTSIDELPQLVNVLKGDMSLVGPRPPIFDEVLRYSPWQRKRLSVTPGITCLWQVSGRNRIKFDEWMQLDLQYINNWSLLLDVKILCKTILAVLSQKGAQ